MKKLTTRRLVRGALIAALYAVLCMAFFTISYGDVNFRVSEALMLLPLLLPESVLGLFLGCLLSNLLGGMGALDILFGSLATLLAAASVRALRKLPPWIAALPVILLNTALVGYFVLHLGAGLPLPFALLSVAIGETVVIYALGLPLYYALNKYLPSKYRK